MSENKKPIKISGGAHATLSGYMRRWTGWGYKASLVLGETGTDSPYASCWHDPLFKVALNPETLLRNPNRVLNTVTPFRLRQEAILTGALLHEAGHARHSHWQPGRYGNPLQAVHDDGQPVTPLVMEFAKTIEEARVEGLIAAEATDIGAHGLAWTMQCSAARVLPMTEVSADPGQAVLDVVCSWVLRVGRQISTGHHLSEKGIGYNYPEWVDPFNNLLRQVLTDHLPPTPDPWRIVDPDDRPVADLTDVMTLLYDAVCADSSVDVPGSTWMVDTARLILSMLFPESEQEQMQASSGCPEDGEGEPQDSGSEDTDADESDDEDSDGESEPDEDGGAGDGDDEADADDTEGESDEDGEDGEGDTEPEDEGSGTEPGAGDSGSDESDSDDGQPSDQPSESALNKQADLQADLEDLEEAANKQAAATQAAEMENPSAGPDPTSASKGDGDSDETPQSQGQPGGASNARGRGRDYNFRPPTRDEREVKKGAERFLRNMIDPSETAKQQITDSPAALVDGAALAAWKAGGQTAAPLFFKRIKRTAQSAPPVEVAILVDRSASMDVLGEPSALLSWALADACLDLRNFAGRGIQVQSTLIHWGSDARVVQANGSTMPGIHEGECFESTVAMAEALDLVAQQIPGFFDPSPTPRNRLLVQFTDWELSPYTVAPAAERVGRALDVGVNMLSVVPMNYSWRSTRLDDAINAARRPLGRTALLRYNTKKPGEVWTAASEVLSGADSNYGF